MILGCFQNDSPTKDINDMEEDPSDEAEDSNAIMKLNDEEHKPDDSMNDPNGSLVYMENI